MQAKLLTQRSHKLLIGALACVFAVAALSAPTAFAAPASGGVIHACVLTKGKKANRGLLRVVRSAKSCKKKRGERPIAWNVAGPSSSGAQGPAGAPGSPGSSGSTGANGAQGPRGEQGSSAQLEEKVRETIKEQGTQLNAITADLSGLGKELLGVETGLGAIEGKLGGVGGLESTVEGIKGKLGGVNGLESTVETIKGKLGGSGGLENTVETLKGQLTGLTGTVETGLSGLKTTVNQVCTQATTLTGQSNSIRGVVEGATTVLGTLSPIKLPALPTVLEPFACK